MSIAIKNANIPQVLLYNKRTVAAANDDIVCPDGNEKSVGRGIKSAISGRISQGLILATRCFNETLPIRTHKIKENAIIKPVCLCFLNNKRRIDIKIQTAPKFPIFDIYGIILSNNKK
jgi:hypothetical protein